MEMAGHGGWLVSLHVHNAWLWFIPKGMVVGKISHMCIFGYMRCMKGVVARLLKWVLSHNEKWGE